ncbi:MAG: glycosyltransferase family A protein [Paracoccaceae bacterium]
MARTLVICPTHDHVDTLFVSIASLQAQHDRDWRLVVICDGAPPRSLQIVEALAARDSRIGYEVFPKGEGFGEAYRDKVIRASSEETILHLGDDDIWSAHHIATMREMLASADWVRQSTLARRIDGSWDWRFANLGTAVARAMAARGTFIDSGLNDVALRRSAYEALPQGWRVPPPDYGASDCYMWMQYMAQPQLRIGCSAAATWIKLPGRAARRDFDPIQRTAEAAPLLAQVNQPRFLGVARRRARLGVPVLRALDLHGAAAASRFDAAMELCGLRIVAPDRPAEPAIDGAAMALPLTAAQEQECRFAWATLRLLAPAGTREGLEDWRQAMAPRFADQCRAYLRELAQKQPDLSDRLADLLAPLAGMKGPVAMARIRAALSRGDLATATEGLHLARRNWPGAAWLAVLEDEIAAAGKGRMGSGQG